MARKIPALRFHTQAPSSKVQLRVGSKHLLDIERLAEDGRGIAHAQGVIWFVAGALATEQVRVCVVSAGRGVIEAVVEQVVQASALRQQPLCPVAGLCGGCTLQHMPYAEQVALKQRNLVNHLQRAGYLASIEWAAPITGPAFGYRRRARLAVRCEKRSARVQVGLRAASSHHIVAIGACPILLPELQRITLNLPELLEQLQTPQAIGHIELFSDACTALLVRCTQRMPEQDRATLRTFCHAHQAQLWWQDTGVPVPDAPEVGVQVYLPGFGLILDWHPGDFIQANPYVNQALLMQALAWLAPKKDERFLDLFCGLGNFTLPLAQKAGVVVGVEGAQAMVARARANAERNQLANVQVYQADLTQPWSLDVPWLQQSYAGIVLDPPRDGAWQVMQHIATLQAKRILYVSCNPATLARDTVQLLAHGYCLERAGILDMFAQTAHLEAMALFVKKN